MFRRFALAVALVPLLAVLAFPGTSLADSAGSPAAGAYVDLGSAHGCAVQRDRAVRCWGRGSSGRLGGGQIDDRLAWPGTAPTQLSPGTTAAISSGDSHTCALLTSGAVRCWGQGGSGQLGSGTRDNRLDGMVSALSGSDEASTVNLGAPATSISAGGDFTCAVTSDGAVRCWGDGAFGELGSRATDNRLDGLDGLGDGPTDAASVVPLGGAATAVSAGPQHACALLTSGAVRCWGSGGKGRLGTGATDDRLDGIGDAGGNDEASMVPLAEPAIAVAAGGAHTCALLASGIVSCWGLNYNGQLGAGRNDDRLDGVVSGTGANATDAPSTVVIKPLNVLQKDYAKAAAIPAVAIAAGESHTCAIVAGGDVRCWGKSDLGQLGGGAVDARLDNNVTQLTDAATRVGGGPTGAGPGLGAAAVGLTAGYDSTCATLATGAVRCWGSGLDGRLGSSAGDSRLDGIVDGGTGTDDASSVPLGAIAGAAGELAIDPSAPSAAGAGTGSAPAGGAGSTPAGGGAAAVAAPAPVAAKPLSFKLTVKGRKASVTALLEPTKAGKCPTSVSVIATEGRAKLGKAKIKAKKKGAYCQISGTVKLSRAVKKGKAATLAVSGKGITARTLAASTAR